VQQWFSAAFPQAGEAAAQLPPGLGPGGWENGFPLDSRAIAAAPVLRVGPDCLRSVAAQCNRAAGHPRLDLGTSFDGGGFGVS